MSKQVKYFLQQSWLLVAASVLFGVLLAVTDAAWRPRIIQNEIDKFNNLASTMLTVAVDFQVALEEVQIDAGKGKKTKIDIQKGLDDQGHIVGWAFVCEGPGFADKIKLVVTVDAEFKKLGGFGVLSSNETPYLGDKIKEDYFRNQFIGAGAGQLVLRKTGDPDRIDNEIIAISGATVSSEAVVKIINNYIGQVKKQLLRQGLIANE